MADGGRGFVKQSMVDRRMALWTEYSPAISRICKSDVALLAALLLGSIVLLYCYAEAQQRKRLPPGPWPWPVVGNFLALSGGMPHRALQKLAAEYGGLMYLRLGSVPCLVVSTAAVAKELYKTNDANFASRPKRLAWTIWHNGEDYRNLVMAAYGPHWRQLRRIYNTELFSPGRQASLRGMRAEEIQYMMNILLNDTKRGDPVNLKVWLHGVTSNIITRMLINKRYYGSSGLQIQREKEELEEMLARVIQVLGKTVISDYVPYLSFITRLQGHASQFEKARDASSRLAEKIFDLEKHKQRSQERRDDESYVPDFVDVLLNTSFESGQHLSDKDICTLLREMLNAGTETSATTIEWATAELVAAPELLKRAQNELDAVVGANRLVEESDLPHLPFLQAVIKEALRLHPPVPLLIPHESHQPTEFLGYRFPAKTILIMNAYTIHRDPSVYANPDNFDPDRFLAHPEVNPLSVNDFYELVPFGAGRRMCPGFDLANTMVSLTLANLVYVFDWSLPHGHTSVDLSECSGISVSPKQALHLVAKPRIQLHGML